MKRKCQLLMKENESLQHSTHKAEEKTGDDTGVVTGDETKSSYEGKIASETSSDNEICHHCRWQIISLNLRARTGACVTKCTRWNHS